MSVVHVDLLSIPIPTVSMIIFVFSVSKPKFYRRRIALSSLSSAVSCFSHCCSDINGSASRALASLRGPPTPFSPSTTLKSASQAVRLLSSQPPNKKKKKEKGLARNARDPILRLESPQRQAQLAQIDIDRRFGLQSLQRLVQPLELSRDIPSSIDRRHGRSR